MKGIGDKIYLNFYRSAYITCNYVVREQEIWHKISHQSTNEHKLPNRLFLHKYKIAVTSSAFQWVSFIVYVTDLLN